MTQKIKNIIKKKHIKLFFSNNIKSKNDENNKLREEILVNIINKNIDEKFYKNTKWKTVKNQLKKWINNITTEKINSISAEKKAGRGNNYDFLLKINLFSGYEYF